jgi:uncharacterized protein (TIGR00288 family)
MIDFDNVTMAIRSNLGQELRNFLNSDIIRGKVSVQRAYADWRRYPQYIVPLSEASIDLIFAPAYGSSKKNATDIRLAIDATELVFTRPEIGTFILLSGDSDFSSLVLKLKEYGKYVIGVGLQESTSDLLVQNCDEYYSYNSLSGLTEASQLETISHDPWELAEMAVKKMAERDDVMRSDRLKQVMLEIDSGFDEKEYGYSKFNRFLAEASSRGLLRLQRIENGQYEVAPADGRGGSGRSTGSSSGGSSGRGGERGRRGRGESRSSRASERAAAPSAAETREDDVDASALKRAYDLLRGVVSRLSEDEGSVRDSEVKRALLEEDERFDEASLGFSKFSRFLRQASDEGVVDLETDEDGNYHVSTGGTGGPASGGASAGESRGGRNRAEGQHRRRDRRGGERERRERGQRERREPAEAEPSRPEPTEPEVEVEAESESEAVGERHEPTTASAAAESMARSRTEAPREAQRESEAAAAPESQQGRERQPTRGGSRGGSADGGSDTHLPGPVDSGASGASGADEDDGATEPAPAGEASTASRSEPGGGQERRGVGLGRRGGRRGASAPERQASQGDAASAGADTTGDAGAGSSEDGDVVEHMVKNYAGVGRKTAEALVDAFGAKVFTVIDEQPDRITNVLPEHRAQAVIEAREAERQDVGSPDEV